MCETDCFTFGKKSVCVCVTDCFRKKPKENESVCVCACVRACVCVCVRVRVCVSVCVCVLCVCVCDGLFWLGGGGTDRSGNCWPSQPHTNCQCNSPCTGITSLHASLHTGPSQRIDWLKWKGEGVAVNWRGISPFPLLRTRQMETLLRRIILVTEISPGCGH